MALKTGTKRAQSYEVGCPHCDRTHETENCSTFWTRHEMESAKPKQECWYCGEFFAMPKPQK